MTSELIKILEHYGIISFILFAALIYFHKNGLSEITSAIGFMLNRQKRRLEIISHDIEWNIKLLSSDTIKNSILKDIISEENDRLIFYQQTGINTYKNMREKLHKFKRDNSHLIEWQDIKACLFSLSIKENKIQLRFEWSEKIMGIIIEIFGCLSIMMALIFPMLILPSSENPDNFLLLKTIIQSFGFMIIGFGLLQGNKQYRSKKKIEKCLNAEILSEPVDPSKKRNQILRILFKLDKQNKWN